MLYRAPGGEGGRWTSTSIILGAMVTSSCHFSEPNHHVRNCQRIHLNNFTETHFFFPFVWVWPDYISYIQIIYHTQSKHTEKVLKVLAHTELRSAVFIRGVGLVIDVWTVWRRMDNFCHFVSPVHQSVKRSRSRLQNGCCVTPPMGVQVWCELPDELKDKPPVFYQNI